MFFSKCPETDTYQKEDSRMHEAAYRGHEAIGSYSALKGLARGTNKGKSRHGRPKYAHQ
jgi:hypothetical protein